MNGVDPERWRHGSAALTGTGAIADWCDGALFPIEQAAMAATGVPRCREFAAGRHLARRLLAEFGVAPVALARCADGTVEWPAGYCGSISHSVGQVAVTVARYPVGIDLERRDRVKPRLLERVARPEELAYWRTLADDAAAQSDYATLVFAAKEAFYKLEYPLTRRRYEFHDVTVIVGAPGEVTATADTVQRRGVWRRVAAHWLWVGFEADQRKNGTPPSR